MLKMCSRTQNVRRECCLGPIENVGMECEGPAKQEQKDLQLVREIRSISFGLGHKPPILSIYNI